MKSWESKLADKWWRMNHLYKIKDKEGNLIMFRPNPIQRQHLAERGSHRRNLILKARQFGFTTLYCIDLLDEALWVTGTTCAILAHERPAVLKIFEIVKRAYVNLPEQLKPLTRTDTKMAYDFVRSWDGKPLDSSIYVAMKIRGGTVQKLHITESAYIKDRAELNSGSKQAVPITGWVSEETTGNGLNDFYDFFIGCHDYPNIGELDYKTYFYPWFIHPEYSIPGDLPEPTLDDARKYGNERDIATQYNLTDGQLLWRRWKVNELRSATSGGGVGLSGIQLFRQEYPATILEAFQSGSGSVFDPEVMNKLSPTPPPSLDTLVAAVPAGQEGREKLVAELARLHKAGVRIWKTPVFGKEYVVGVDPSGGLGSDFTCIDVWERGATVEEPIEQMAQYYVKCRPDESAEWVKAIAELYNGAFVGVENNMLSTILFLSKIYDNYYASVIMDEKTQRRTRKIGWSTNTKTRDIMIDDFLRPFEEGSLKINSAITLGEMRTFVKKDNGKREHADGKHDDALFAGFVAMQMRKYKKPLAKVYATKPKGL